MPGIFISYRRIDAVAWAGHLFSDLRKSFGADQDFMGHFSLSLSEQQKGDLVEFLKSL